MRNTDNTIDIDPEATPTVQTLPYRPTALPDDEPAALPLALSRGDILRQIEELEGTLYYMGELHPRRDEMRQRLSGLRTLLERWGPELPAHDSPNAVHKPT